MLARISAFCWTIAPLIENGAVVPAEDRVSEKVIPCRAIASIATQSHLEMLVG
jgi:hypothetical protein